jgi:hypothetical protein
VPMSGPEPAVGRVVEPEALVEIEATAILPA